MDFVKDVLVFLHFIGLAALFGGLFVQLKASPRVVNAAVLHGALTQVVTGLLLVGVHEAEDGTLPDYFHMKVGTKLVIALVITVLAFVNRKRPSITDGLFFALMGLTALNIGIAVFWHN